MKRWRPVLFCLFAILAVAAAILVVRFAIRGSSEHRRFEEEATELVVSHPPGTAVSLFKAGRGLSDETPVEGFDGERAWLPRGDYFLRVDGTDRPRFYPVSITAYRGGPDAEGQFGVTIRNPPPNDPPQLRPDSPPFSYIPSGHFLFGDRLNQQEPHYVWLTAYFLGAFEVTNREFREFESDANGYENDENWTEAGRQWKARKTTQASSRLRPLDPAYARFGQADQPVLLVTWFEANAFCRWLTRRLGGSQWIFALPNEAEWEKAARGPDSFDYGLGATISDNEVALYNWKKNPSAEVTAIGWEQTRSTFRPNRYGLYHMTGNAAEWTQSVARPFSRRTPYSDDDRNSDDNPGLRVMRGGSWYSAAVSTLSVSYRETFQPEVATPYLGFRVAARPLP